MEFTGTNLHFATKEGFQVKNIRLVPIMLAFLFLISVCGCRGKPHASSVPRSESLPPHSEADTTVQHVDALKQSLKTYLLQNKLCAPQDIGKVDTLQKYGESQGYSICYWYGVWVMEEEHLETIGEFTFHSTSTHMPFPLGLYIIKDDEVLSLREAYEQKKIALDDVARVVPMLLH